MQLNLKTVTTKLLQNKGQSTVGMSENELASLI